MAAVLPTVALTSGAIPDASSSDQAIIRFAQTFNAYDEVGQEGINALLGRQRAGELEAPTLDELRTLLFARQRAHYHQGGGWPGEPDTLMEEMRALVAEIRQRVEARGPGIGVWTGDITRLAVDAIANAANETLLGGGGVDGAIHRAAGPDLLTACRAIPELRPGVRCPVGEARLTPGFNLASDHVIHAVGPIWRGGGEGEDDVLASAYRSVVELAEAHQLEGIAIPAISTGVYGFPADRAAGIAVGTLRAWQSEHAHPQRIVLVGFDDDASATLHRALGVGPDATV